MYETTLDGPMPGILRAANRVPVSLSYVSPFTRVLSRIQYDAVSNHTEAAMFQARKTVKFARRPMLAMALVLVPLTAEAGCRLFQHRDYGGSGYTLNHFERMKMVRGESLGCTINGHGRMRKYNL